MESYLDQCRDLARRWDAARPRTRQTAIGWSGMADCRAYLAHIEAGVWPTDEPDKWRAIAGTALHSWWTHLRRVECAERGINAAFGVPVTYGGVPGKLDEVLWPSEPGGRWEVTDWKFPTLSSVRLWDDAEFLDELFVQPHGYAAGVVTDEGGAGWEYDLDPDACVVRLAGFPVNAKSMDDWACHERPFSRQTADDALDRLASVRGIIGNGVEPNDPSLRDKPVFFCSKWCEFYTACRGGEEPKELELITDPELKAAVNAYGLANELVSANQKIKAEMRDLLEDARGRTDEGFKIWKGRGAAAKLEYDEAAVEAALGSRGIPVTEVQRWTPPGQQKLYVKRT